MFVCLSVRTSAWTKSATTGRIITKFDIWLCFENRTRITGTLHEDHYAFLIISRSFLLRIRNVSDKRCRDDQNTHFRSIFFFKSCRLWNSVAKYCIVEICMTKSHRKHNVVHSKRRVVKRIQSLKYFVFLPCTGVQHQKSFHRSTYVCCRLYLFTSYFPPTYFVC